MRPGGRLVVILFCALLLSAFATRDGWSQLSTGTISGTVTDRSGAVVPRAIVTIVNEGTNGTITTASNTDGTFVRAAVPIGTYTITVTKTGFSAYTEKSVQVHPAQVVSVNPLLAVGMVTQKVQVSASAAQVQSSTPEVSSEVSSKEVRTLPLNGRNFESLSALMPGVTNIAPDTAQVQGGFIQTNIMSVNGMGISGTGYYLDGTWDIAPGNMIGLGITPNPDSIQEVRVLQNNYSTQYSLYGSNAVLLQTRSGTDTFHGTAWEYVRNDALDARNFFSPSVAPLKQNIFGYNLSGPLYLPGHRSSKKKTFFFWSQQWSIQHIGLPSTGGGTGITLQGADPTLAMRNGAFNTPITDPLTGQAFPQTSPGVYQIPPDRLNANAVVLLNAFAPLPNNLNNGFVNYINLNPEINNTRDDEIKVDHNFGSRFRLMAEYLDDHQDNENPANPYLGSPFPISRMAVTTFNDLAQVQLTATLTPSMVNTTSINMLRYNPSLLARGLWLQNQLPDFHQNLPFSGFLSDRLPQVNFAGGWAAIGQASVIPSPHAANLVDTLSDDWSWVRGKHLVQAGMALQYDTSRQNTFSASNGQWFFSGQFTGNPVADYLLGDAASFFQASNVLRVYNHWESFSPYLEDRWKVTRRLTLTGGIRYLFMTLPNIQKQFATNFVPTLYKPAEAPIVNPDGTITPTSNYNPLNGLVFNGVNGVPLQFTTAHQNNWGPTLGFAYDVFGNGKTSLRGGFGITYTSIPTGTDCALSCTGNPPIIQSLTLVTPSFPNPIGAAVAPPGAPSLVATSPSFYPTTGAMTYSLSLEHQFSTNWFLSVTGAGNATLHGMGMLNINQALPDPPYDFNPIINTGTVFPNVFSPYRGYGNITQASNAIKQRWNALEIGLRHPVGHNVTLTSAYTWQHCLSNAGGGTFIGGVVGALPSQDSYHPLRQYGTCTLNVFNVWTSSLIWALPWFNAAQGVKSVLLKGWQFADMTTIQGGFALVPGLSTSNPGLATMPNRLAGSPISGPRTVNEWFNTGAFSAPAPGYFGDAALGSITGPGVVNFDMAFYKDFHIKERHTFQFRAELFNIFNHTNFSGVQTAYGAGNFGQVYSALDPRIAEFALRYQF